MGEQGKRRAILVGAAPGCIPVDRLKLDRRTDFVICADGGQRTLKQLGIQPDWYVGDNDSGGNPDGLPAFLLPPEKDVSDLEMAVHKALELGFRKLVMIGCTGGRLDHSLSNLSLLEQIQKRGGEGTLLDERNEARLLGPGRYQIENRPAYHYISLIPVDETLSGVTLSGFKYSVENVTLIRGTTRGISNEILPGQRAIIQIKAGKAFLIRSDPVTEQGT